MQESLRLWDSFVFSYALFHQTFANSIGVAISMDSVLSLEIYSCLVLLFARDLKFCFSFWVQPQHFGKKPKEKLTYEGT